MRKILIVASKFYLEGNDIETKIEKCFEMLMAVDTFLLEFCQRELKKSTIL
jgi:hypothetical protein